MYLVSVIPISRGIPLQALTYVSQKKMLPGDVVHAPVRKKLVASIVEECRVAEDAKAEIRALGYPLRTLKAQEGIPMFSPHFISAAREIAEYTSGSTGSVLASLVPVSILKLKIPYLGPRTEPKDTGVFVLQTDTEERVAIYKSIIREEFAKKRSVLVILPSIQDIDMWLESIGRGIQDYTHVFHGGLPPKKMVGVWKNICDTDHSVLILGTPSALSLPRSDIGTIIVDRESASLYKTQYRPFVDYRKVAESIAKISGVRLLFGDIFLRIETLFRKDEGELQEFQRLKFRLLSTAEHVVTDLRVGEQAAAGNIALFSPELKAMLLEGSTRHERCVLLGARKGYAPMTVCGDCGSIVACTVCHSPVVLYKHAESSRAKDAQNIFLCHRCGEKRDAGERCKICNSWRLVSLGHGLDQVEEGIKKQFPAFHVFRLDRDHVQTHKEALAVMKQFEKTPRSVLLGTEMLLPYLTMPVEYGAVLSLQSLLTIPDYTMEEKVFRLIIGIRSKVTKKLIVESRDPTNEFYVWATQGNLLDAYRKTLSERKTFHYPPFTVMIKMTCFGTPNTVTEELTKLREQFVEYGAVSFPGFVSKTRAGHRAHLLLAIPRKVWPHPQVLRRLRELPRSIQVQVDPESLI